MNRCEWPRPKVGPCATLLLENEYSKAAHMHPLIAQFMAGVASILRAYDHIVPPPFADIEESVSMACAQGMEPVEALVVVNSASRLYNDFERYMQPYLDHFGLPYRRHDLASSPLPSDVDRYALIVVGHGELDVTGAYLDGPAQRRLVAALGRYEERAT